MVQQLKEPIEFYVGGGDVISLDFSCDMVLPPSSLAILTLLNNNEPQRRRGHRGEGES